MKAKPGQLKSQWGRIDRHNNPDLCYVAGEGVPRCDMRLLDNVFAGERRSYDGTIEPSFFEELKLRGYDVSTFRFSIQKTPRSGAKESRALEQKPA